MWFDSHCHLHLCESEGPDLRSVIDGARIAGVLEMLAVGIDLESSKRSVEIAAEAGVYASAGLHPNSAEEWNDEVALAIDALLEDPSVVAVGETGLDFYRDHASPERQREVFSAHIRFARKHDKPLVIHTRESMDAALDQLAEEGADPPFIFHCWSGSPEQMKTALDLGAYISFAGNVSFKNAESLRDAAKLVPEARLLVETDSPYLAPVPHRGKSNEPRFVPFVGLAVAQAREVSVHMLAERTAQNARTVFRIDR